MRQNLIAHEKRLLEMAATEAHVQMLIENLSLSAATQDGRSTNLEQHTSHLSNSVEALRAFQEAQYSGPPPEYSGPPPPNRRREALQYRRRLSHRWRATRLIRWVWRRRLWRRRPSFPRRPGARRSRQPGRLPLRAREAAHGGLRGAAEGRRGDQVSQGDCSWIQVVRPLAASESPCGWRGEARLAAKCYFTRHGASMRNSECREDMALENAWPARGHHFQGPHAV